MTALECLSDDVADFSKISNSGSCATWDDAFFHMVEEFLAEILNQQALQSRSNVIQLKSGLVNWNPEKNPKFTSFVLVLSFLGFYCSFFFLCIIYYLNQKGLGTCERHPTPPCPKPSQNPQLVWKVCCRSTRRSVSTPSWPCPKPSFTRSIQTWAYLHLKRKKWWTIADCFKVYQSISRYKMSHAGGEW